MKNIALKTEQETIEFAEQVAKNPPHVLLLYGHLGAGKTFFTQGYFKALGVSEPVVSPTFSIAREYPDESCVHFDLYRIKSDIELEEIGFEEYLQRFDHVVIEWPELAVDFIENLVRFRFFVEDGIHYVEVDDDFSF